MHDLEAASDDEGAAEQAFDLFGRGIGGHIEIFGLDAQQQVAHSAADNKGLEACLLQRMGDAHRIGGDVGRIDAMLRRAEYDGCLAFARLAGGAQNAANKFLNHQTDSVWASHAP